MCIFPPSGSREAVCGGRGERAGGRWERLLNKTEGRRKRKARRKKEGRSKGQERERRVRVQTDWGTQRGEKDRSVRREGFKINCIRRLIQSKSIQEK